MGGFERAVVLATERTQQLEAICEESLASTERELGLVHEAEARSCRALADQASAREKLLKDRCEELEEAAYADRSYTMQASTALEDAARMLQSEEARAAAARGEEAR